MYSFLPILLIALWIVFGIWRTAARKGRAGRVATPDVQPAIPREIPRFEAPEKPASVPHLVQAKPRKPAPAVRRPVAGPVAHRPARYLLDADSAGPRRPDRIAGILRTIEGRGLCSPKKS